MSPRSCTSLLSQTQTSTPISIRTASCGLLTTDEGVCRQPRTSSFGKQLSSPSRRPGKQLSSPSHQGARSAVVCNRARHCRSYSRGRGGHTTMQKKHGTQQRRQSSRLLSEQPIGSGLLHKDRWDWVHFKPSPVHILHLRQRCLLLFHFLKPH